MRLDGLPKLEDLREMSEEQFVEAFEIVFRCALRLSQTDLATKLGIERARVQDLEAGRSRWLRHKRKFFRIAKRIGELLKIAEVSPDLALATFKIFKIFSHKDAFKQDKNPLQEISKEELRKWFEEIRERSRDFTVFSPLILAESPQSILIFRLLLGKFVSEFHKIIKVDESTLRKWEHGKQGISLKTAVRVIKIIESLFSKLSSPPKFEDLLPLFIRTKEMHTRSLELARKHGLLWGKKLKLTEQEEKIQDILIEAGIEFEPHGVVDGLKRSHCVDFVISHSSKPSIVVECFTWRTKPQSTILHLIRDKDHRFQMLKSKNPDLKTILCVDVGERSIIKQEVHKMIWLEILSTDFVLVGDEVKKLPEVIKRIMSTQNQVGK